jgi:DNA-binding transcriptional ArsR family regulator
MYDTTRLSGLFERSLPFFTALGDEVRQQLLLLMMDGVPRSVAELTMHTQLSRPAISHHLKILKQAGMIDEQKKGRHIYYHPKLGQYYEVIKTLIDEIDCATHQQKEHV